MIVQPQPSRTFPSSTEDGSIEASYERLESCSFGSFPSSTEDGSIEADVWGKTDKGEALFPSSTEDGSIEANLIFSYLVPCFVPFPSSTEDGSIEALTGSSGERYRLTGFRPQLRTAPLKHCLRRNPEELRHVSVLN